MNADLSVRNKRPHFRACNAVRAKWTSCSAASSTRLEVLTDDEVEALEHLMEAPDPKIYLWVTRNVDVPMEFDTPVFRKMVAFHKNGPK